MTPQPVLVLTTTPAGRDRRAAVLVTPVRDRAHALDLAAGAGDTLLRAALGRVQPGLDLWAPRTPGREAALDECVTSDPAGHAAYYRGQEEVPGLTALLHRAGFSPQDAVLVVDTVIDLVVEHRGTTERLDGPRRARAGREAGRDAAPTPATRDDLAASWPAAAPGTDEPRTDELGTTAEEPLVAAWRTAVRTDPALDRRLDLALAGARTLLPPRTPGASRPLSPAAAPPAP